MRFKLQLVFILPFLFTVGCATQHIHIYPATAGAGAVVTDKPLPAGAVEEHDHIEQGQVESPYIDPKTLEVGQIVHQPTGRMMTEAELYDYLATQRIIYVGESHDSVDDHAVQLKVIQALNERFPGKIAVGMEMLRTNFQQEADKWAAGELSEKELTRTWVKSWGNTLPYYKAILDYVRDNNLPLLAMNQPKRKMGMMGHGKGKAMMPAGKHGAEKATAMHKEDAATDGAANMEAHKAAPEAKEEPVEHKAPVAKESMAKMKHEADALPVAEPEIDYDDPYYNEFIGAFFTGHGEGKPEIGNKFLKSQLLWDETMAQTGAEFLSKPENADVKLVVLAGGNHVRHGFGVPRRLFRRLPAPYTIIDTVVIDFPEEKKDKLMKVDLPLLPLPASHFKWAVNYNDLEGTRIMLGVGIADAEPEGVLVKSVLAESSAEEAGVQVDDIIVDVDGVEIKEVFDLTYELGKKEADTKGTVTVLRDGERTELPVTYSTLKPHDKK